MSVVCLAVAVVHGRAVAVAVIVAAVAVRPLDAITAVAVASWTSCCDRDVPGCGRGAAWPRLWRPPSFRRRAVVATRRRILVFAMVLVVSVLSWFAI